MNLKANLICLMTQMARHLSSYSESPTNTLWLNYAYVTTELYIRYG